MHSSDAISTDTKVNIRVTISTTSGCVGDPIELMFEIECSTISPEARNVYDEIDFATSSWAISGAFGGEVDRSQQSYAVKTTAIPVAAGEMKERVATNFSIQPNCIWRIAHLDKLFSSYLYR